MSRPPRPILVRLILTVVAAALGAAVGYLLGLGFILVVVALFGHADDTHPVRQLVIVGTAYAITGATALVAAFVAWRRWSR